MCQEELLSRLAETVVLRLEEVSIPADLAGSARFQPPVQQPRISASASLLSRSKAPRATLVKLPPPGAQLVRLQEWRIGEQRPVTLPYNVEVLTTYKGRLPAEWMLPASGNQLGDTWVVGETPWVWIWAPGASQADWIDP